MTIVENGKRAVRYSSQEVFVLVGVAITEPQVTHGRHWFEVKILNPGSKGFLLIGWSAPTPPGLGPRNYTAYRGCSWCVPLVYTHNIVLSD